MRPEIPAIDAIRHVHFVAVAGTAMGTLACMLSDMGMRVTGSDVGAYPPMSDQLHNAGIRIEKGFAAVSRIDFSVDSFWPIVSATSTLISRTSRLLIASNNSPKNCDAVSAM